MLFPPGFGERSMTSVEMLCERRVLAAERPARPVPITITECGEAISVEACDCKVGGALQELEMGSLVFHPVLPYLFYLFMGSVYLLV